MRVFLEKVIDFVVDCQCSASLKHLVIYMITLVLDGISQGKVTLDMLLAWRKACLDAQQMGFVV